MTVVRIPVVDDDAGAPAATTTSSAHNDTRVRTDANAVVREPTPPHEQQEEQHQKHQQEQQQEEQQQQQQQEQEQQQEAYLGPDVVIVPKSSNYNNDTNTTTTINTPLVLAPPTSAASFPSSSRNGVSIGAAVTTTVTTIATAITNENENTTTNNNTSCNTIGNPNANLTETPQNTTPPSAVTITATTKTTQATHLNTQQQQPQPPTTTTNKSQMSLTDFCKFVNNSTTQQPIFLHLVRSEMFQVPTTASNKSQTYIPLEQLRQELIAQATEFPHRIPTPTQLTTALAAAAAATAGATAHTQKKRLCRFPGCTRVIKSQGHCQRHGAKAKRCKVEGCDKQAQGTHQGMCKRHWREWTDPGQQEARAQPAGTVATTACATATAAAVLAPAHTTLAKAAWAAGVRAATAAAAAPPAREVEPVVPPPPPPAEGVSVYATILPASIAYRPNNTNSSSTSSDVVPPAPQTSQPYTENWESFREGGPGGVVSVQLQEKPAPAAVPAAAVAAAVPTTAPKTTKKKVVVESPAMPLVTFLADGARTQPCGWHRHGERRARGLYPVTSSSAAVVQPFEAWETQLALVEILLLGGGTPSANFQDLAYAWGREPGFHRSVVSKLCHRRGEISQRQHHKPPSRRSSSHHKTGTTAHKTTTQPNQNHNTTTTTTTMMTTTNSDNTTYTNLKSVEAKKVAEEQWHATNGITKKQKLSNHLPNQQLQQEDIERRRRQPDIQQPQPQHSAQQSVLLVHDTVGTTNQGGSVLPIGNYPQHSAVETQFTATPPAAGGTQQQQLPPPVYPLAPPHSAVETPVVSTPSFPAAPYTHALQQSPQQTQHLLQQQPAVAAAGTTAYNVASANHSMNVGPYSDLLHGRRNSNTTIATLLASSQTKNPTARLYTAPPQYPNSHPQKLPTLVPGESTAGVPMPLPPASAAGVSPVLLEVLPANLMTLAGGMTATTLPWTEQEDSIVMEAVTLSSEQPFTRWSDLAAQLPGRVGKQVRDRWTNQLNPHIIHRPFRRDEDLVLWEGHTKLGKRWVELSTTLFQSTRSENQIKNRWYSASFQKFIADEFGPTAYEDPATARRNSNSSTNSSSSSSAAIVDSKASLNDRTLLLGESTVVVPMPLPPASAVPAGVPLLPEVLLADPSTIAGSRTTTTNTYATVAEAEDEAGTVEAAAAAAAAMNAMHHTTEETMHTLGVENNNNTEEDGVPSPYRHV